MYTRSAIFTGTIKEGHENDLYSAIEERLLPAWRRMLHAIAVRVYRPVACDKELMNVFLVQEIDYPSLEAIEEALDSPLRIEAQKALASIQHLYDGFHYHYIYERIGVEK